MYSFRPLYLVQVLVCEELAGETFKIVDDFEGAGSQVAGAVGVAAALEDLAVEAGAERVAGVAGVEAGLGAAVVGGDEGVCETGGHVGEVGGGEVVCVAGGDSF